MKRGRFVALGSAAVAATALPLASMKTVVTTRTLTTTTPEALKQVRRLYLQCLEQGLMEREVIVSPAGYAIARARYADQRKEDTS